MGDVVWLSADCRMKIPSGPLTKRCSHVKTPRSLLLSFAVVTGLAACADAGGSGGYEWECSTQSLVHVQLVDVSASGRNEVVLGERLNAVQVAAEKVADCEGKLVVIAWAGSSSASEQLFSGEIPIAGATEIGRDRKIGKAVAAVMKDVRAKISSAMTQLAPEKSDLAGAFYLLGDMVSANRGNGAEISAEILTDAISTGGASPINDPGLTKDKVYALVAGENLPNLEGVSIAVRGVGRVASSPAPPQDYIQLVQEYASGMCVKTGAECSVFTTVMSS